MSLPTEEVRALVWARKFLAILAVNRGRSAAPRTRHEACCRIRHYPGWGRLHALLRPEYARFLPKEDEGSRYDYREYWTAPTAPRHARTPRTRSRARTR